MSSFDWKAEKEQFVSHLNGTSFAEVQSLLLVPPLAIFLNGLIITSTIFLLRGSRRFCLPIGFTLCLVPIGCFCFLPWQWVLLMLAAAVPFWILTVEKSPELLEASVVKNALHIGRGMLLFTTCLTILAVDFRIYPRRHAKTEHYGYSLMDAGVGAFVFANGVFSPWARLLPSFLRDSSSDAWRESARFIRVIKSSAILVLLGLLRLAAVKATGYQEHVSEYGVHGNFFIVLAGLRVLSGCLDPIFSSCQVQPYVVSLGFILMQETLLRVGVEGLVVSLPSVRSNLPIFEQNIELFASFYGYAAIYYAGVDFGLRIRQKGGWGHRSAMLLYLAVAIVSLDVGFGVFPPSRRMVNAGYIGWTILANWIQFSSCILAEGFFVIRMKPEETDDDKAVDITILESSNPFLLNFSRHGLALFLMANVLTGLVNLSINTLAVETYGAVIVILTYAVVLGLIAQFLDNGKQRAKKALVAMQRFVEGFVQL